MATPKSTGVRRPRVRLDGVRSRTSPSLSRPYGESVADLCLQDLPGSLADIARCLKVIGAVAVTAEIALRTQNCEQDADIAVCLRHGVVDALTVQIERVNRLCRPVGAEPS